MGATRTRISTMVVAVACAAAVLAGCTGGDDPPVTTPTADASSPTVRASPSASPSVTASPSPSSTVLTEAEVIAQLPEETKHQSMEGAVWFSQYFLEQYAPMFAAPYDASVYATLSSSDCAFCASAIEQSEAIAEVGATASGGEFSWPGADPLALHGRGGLAEDGYWYIELDFSLTDTITHSADATELGSMRGGSGVLRTKLAWVDAHWQMLGVNLEFDDE